MFDVINGLPIHALVVHGVVVLLPLMALVTIAVGFRPAWRQQAAWWVVVADAAVLLLVFVAVRSGETFQRRLGGQVAIDHGQQARLLLPISLAMLVGALLVALLARRGGGASTGVAALVTLVGLVAIGWTVRAGDSGARAVWESVIQGTQAP